MDLIIFAILALLAVIIIQDIRSRHIHVLLPVSVLCLSTAFFMQKYAQLEIILINIGFFVITIVVLTAYLSIKERVLVNPFTNHFGLGDFLFYISVAPLFSSYNYILYFILSLVFSLIIYACFKKFMMVQTIPLAGFASIFLILVVFRDMVFNVGKLTLLYW